MGLLTGLSGARIPPVTATCSAGKGPSLHSLLIGLLQMDATIYNCYFWATVAGMGNVGSRCAPASASALQDMKQASPSSFSSRQQEGALHRISYTDNIPCRAPLQESGAHFSPTPCQAVRGVLQQARTVRCAAASVAEPQVATTPADTFPTLAARQAAFTEDILPDQVNPDYQV